MNEVKSPKKPLLYYYLLMLLVLLPVFAALWLLGGQYLLGIPLVLALGWLWSLWSRREQTVFVILSVCILVMTDCVMLLI